MANRLGKTAILLGTVVAKAIWEQVKDTDFVKEKKEQVRQKITDFEEAFWKWANHIEQEQRALNNDQHLSFVQACHILEIPTTASLDQAKQAWKNKMKSCHPDRFINASQQEQQRAHLQAQKINQAFQVLKLKLS